jgi:hypothetical protein
MGVVNATSRPPYPQERPGTHCVGGWVDPRAALDWGYGIYLRTRKKNNFVTFLSVM